MSGPGTVRVETLTADDWRLLRRLRVDALRDSPASFVGSPDAESAVPEDEWRRRAGRGWAVARSTERTSEGDDDAVAVFQVSSAPEEFGADCWVSGWWVAPAARGAGVTRTMLRWLDEECARRGWRVQGLGVWADNTAALAAFGRLGFTAAGDVMVSERYAGRLWWRMLRESA